LLRVKPMPSAAFSHVCEFLQSNLDSILRNCSSSAFVHLPLFAAFISGFKILFHRCAHILLVRVLTWFDINFQFGTPCSLTPSSNLVSSSFVHLVSGRLVFSLRVFGDSLRVVFGEWRFEGGDASIWIEANGSALGKNLLFERMCVNL